MHISRYPFTLSFVFKDNTYYTAMQAVTLVLTLCNVNQVWVDDDDDQAEALAMVVRTGVPLCMFWYRTPCKFELAVRNLRRQHIHLWIRLHKPVTCCAGQAPSRCAVSKM